MAFASSFLACCPRNNTKNAFSYFLLLWTFESHMCEYCQSKACCSARANCHGALLWTKSKNNGLFNCIFAETLSRRNSSLLVKVPKIFDLLQNVNCRNWRTCYLVLRTMRHNFRVFSPTISPRKVLLPFYFQNIKNSEGYPSLQKHA